MSSNTCAYELCEAPPVEGSKYCGDSSHRNKQYRLNKRKRKEAAAKRKLPELPKDKPVQAEFQRQIAPSVEEALTEDVLASIRNAVRLTPQALQQVSDLMNSDNEFTRLHAAQTILKYTIGQNALLPSMDKDSQSLTVVIEGLDRPETVVERKPPQTATELDESLNKEDEHTEPYRICDFCRQPKPESEFIGNSNRCIPCFDRLREGAEARVGS